MVLRWGIETRNRLEKAELRKLGIAVEVAHRYPDRVSGLILLGGYAAGWRKFGDPELRRKREAMLELMHVALEGKNHILMQAVPSWPHFLREVRAFLAELEG